MYSLLRPLLFSLEPEKAHQLSLELLKYAPAWLFNSLAAKPRSALGLHFPHPLGLAAGLDKNGEYLEALAKLGFSFIEIGTVTPRPQPGNPKPRLFRLAENKALINRMGFNNKGVDYLVENLKKTKYRGILGVNIGKNKDTPLALAAADYKYCLAKVYPFAAYITVNISSPNTPDLRLLQQEEFFQALVKSLVDEQQRLADHYQCLKPLLIKLSPDESADNLKKMAETMVNEGIAGLIISNTTANKESVKAHPLAQEAGGLSGEPLFSLSTEALTLLKKTVGDALTLIGVGGIDDAHTAQQKLAAGADLLQLYTGLIYQGPNLIAQIVNKLAEA